MASNTRIRIAAVALAGSAIALIAAPALTQGSSTTVARYTMDAGTISGIGAMGRGGGGGIGAAMAMMRGQGGAAAHELVLRLGTGRTASGTPAASHTLPSGARFGPTLPLVTPQRQAGTPGEYTPQTPKGRLLLFWGCGERAPAGQPVVIDFAKMATGQIPPGLYAQPLAIAEEWRITQENSRTYGDWPNGTDAKPVPANASLLGAHKVSGNYTPDIAFTLDTDFMAPIALRTSALPSGAFAMNWTAVPGATGYYAWAFSAKGDRGGAPAEMVWWTSSASQAFGGPMWDWLSPAAVAKLVEARTVMAPAQTECTVPAEVKQAGGEVSMASLYAYGPERNFAYPPRPANAKTPWNPEWIARARFRSMTMTMLGMDMGAMGGTSGDRGASAPQAPASGKPKCRKGLAGMAQRAAGLCE